MNTLRLAAKRTWRWSRLDVNQGAQVGQTASSGYLNSFNALARSPVRRWPSLPLQAPQSLV